jgi:hypothetical protein
VYKFLYFLLLDVLSVYAIESSRHLPSMPTVLNLGTKCVHYR